jgi:hypothetical protein
MPARPCARRRCPSGCSRGRWPMPAACTPRKVRGAHRPAVRAAPRAAGLCTPAFPRRRARREPCRTPTAGTTCTRTTRSACGRWMSRCVIASIKTKMHAISPDVPKAWMQAVDLAEKGLRGPGDLVGRRDVLGRRRPAGHAAGLHGGGHLGHRRRRGTNCKGDAAAALCQRADGLGDPRPGAGRRLRDGGLQRKPRRCTWRATSAWSRSAWAWCPAPAA